jgi:hypothetical protein
MLNREGREERTNAAKGIGMAFASLACFAPFAVQTGKP